MLKSTIREILKFSGPIILGQIGMMLFSISDLLVVGRYSNESLSAIGVAAAIFAPFTMTGIAICFGVNPVISKHLGEGKDDTAGLFTAVFSSTCLGIILVVLLNLLNNHLYLFKLNPKILPLVNDYLGIAQYSLIPALIYQSYKDYLQSYNIIKFMNLIIIIFNLLNLLINYIFVFGLLGIPELGIKGAAYATLLTRTLMAAAAHFFTIKHMKMKILFSFSLFKEYLKIGVPSGIGTLFEVLVFSFVTILIGKMSIISSSSHNIAINYASLTFMVPLAIGSAMSTRIGYCLGNQDFIKLKLYIKSGLILSGSIMLLFSGTYIFIPSILAKLATDDPWIIKYTSELFLIVALFQVPDGIQITLWGALRGLNSTKVPMLISSTCHWLLGLPIGYYLAFEKSMEAKGLWIGLAIGLLTMAVGLLIHLKFRLTKLT